MRIWSLDLSLIDGKGLVALWRETLGARRSLSAWCDGKPVGYSNHPQLDRFKSLEKPIDAINQYLELIFNESKKRGYNFNQSKLQSYESTNINVNSKQLQYEFDFLCSKLKQRDVDKYNQIKDITPKSCDLFNVIPGEIETWEKVKEF